MFPELTKAENEIIQMARNNGFNTFFPCFPSAKEQALKTLKAAKEFLLQKCGS